jgi:hypothetical protein
MARTLSADPNQASRACVAPISNTSTLYFAPLLRGAALHDTPANTTIPSRTICGPYPSGAGSQARPQDARRLAAGSLALSLVASTLCPDLNALLCSASRLVAKYMHACVDRSNNDAVQDGTIRAASMSLPRDLTLGTDVALRQAFVPELQTLREQALSRFHRDSVPHQPVAPAIKGQLTAGALAMEVHACFDASSVSDRAAVAPFGVRVLACPDRKAHADILFDLAREHVLVDRSSTDGDIRAGPLVVDALCLHAYVDHSVVEVIFGNRTAITAYVHVPAPDCSLFSLVGDGTVELLSFDVWALSQANNFA